MTQIRASLLALGLLAGLAPAFAQVPPPVPALPDTERRTSYSLSAGLCTCNVNFALYGDSTDYGNWLEVYLTTGSGASAVTTRLTAVTDYTITSPTGQLSSIPRPITDAVLTLAAAKTGTLQIVGSRRPRRVSQFTESRGVTARDLNQALTDIIAQNRETWDRTNDVTGRALLTNPGETIGLLPSQAARAGGILAFDTNGNPIAQALLTGLGNVIGPNTSVVGHIATFGNATGTILLDGGLVGAGDFVGPAGAVIDHVLTFSNVNGKVGKDSGFTLTPSTGTLTVTNGKTLALTNTLTFGGTDSSTIAFGTGGTVAYAANNLSIFAATTSAQLAGVLSDETGTGPNVFANSPTLVTPNLGTPSTLVLTSATGLPVASGIAGLGAGVATALSNALNTAGGVVGFSGALGTPTSGVLTSATGLPISTGVSGLATGIATFLGAPSSSNLLAALTDETGTGAAVFGTAPTIASPAITGGTHTALTSLGIRSTGTGAFDVLFANTENLTASRTLALTLNNGNRALNLSGDLTLAGAFSTSGGSAITLTSTGTTNVTLPTSGTLAAINISQTFSSTNVFSALQQFTDAKFSSGKIYPTSDGTTALQITKADGVTRILNVDTTNARIGINKTAGAFDLDINGPVNVGTTLTFGTLDPTSLGTSTSTITGLTVNNTPNASNDYLLYYSAADGRIRKGTVGAIAAGATAGVASINGLTGGLSIVGGDGTTIASGGSSVTLTSAPPGPQGRVTLTSATPVMTSSVAGATTVYYTPDNGGQYVPIYNGSLFAPVAFGEVSQTTTDTTKSPAAVAASKVYDIFCWVDSGTNRCTRGPAWTNSSTRGYTLTMVNGIALNTSAITNGPAASRGTWVGTIASNASSTIDYILGFPTSGGGASVLNVWNTYNRVATPTNVVDTGAAYTYTLATTRQARLSAGNQITFVVGDQRNAVQVSYGTENNPIGSAASTQIGVGFDTTTAFSGAGRSFIKNTGTIDLVQFTATSYPWQPAVGLHVLSANERSDGTNASFFNNSSLATLSAVIWN